MMNFLHRRTRGRNQRGSAGKQRGFVAIEFVAGIGLLVLPVALVVLAFPTWAERQEMARVAAREAARTYALTVDPVAAQNAVNQVATNYKVDPSTITLRLGDLPAAPINPGDTVSATVTVKIPALNIGIIDIDAAEVDYSQTHDEPLDVYRSREVQ